MSAQRCSLCWEPVSMRPDRAEFRVELPEGWAHKKCAEPSDEERRLREVFPEMGPVNSRRWLGPEVVAEQLGHAPHWLGDGYWRCACGREGRNGDRWRGHAKWVVATS